MDESDSWLVAIVASVLLMLAMSNMNRRAWIVIPVATMILLLAACGSDAVEQSQVVAATPTAIPTTAPVLQPTATPVPAPTATAVPQPTSTPLPTPLPTVAPTMAPTATVQPTVLPAAVDDAAPTVTAVPEATEIPTAVPTGTAEEGEVQQDASQSDSDTDSDVEPTAVAETPTAVVVSSEPPLECYDRDVKVYRGHVDGVDSLSFEGGRVYCSGAGTNAVSAAASYRHSSGLVVSRNADYIFNAAGTAYIPYSGAFHFCMNGQPASEQFRADTVPTLLIVIDNEAQRLVAQGASGPSTFTSSGSQC